jgi:phosphatidylglycerol lysyltransferase
VFKDGRYWHIAGGILAPDELVPQIISWLKVSTQASGTAVLFHAMPERLMPEFADGGWEITMVGIEPIIELETVDWSGPQMRWIRRQTSFCSRHGLVVTEISKPDLSLRNELRQIYREDLADRPYPNSLRLMEGTFDPEQLQRRRLFVATDKEHQAVEGFLICSPMRGGSEWAFESYRRRRQAPRGPMAFLFRTVMDQLKDEGCDRVSLCLVPGKRVNDPVLKQGAYAFRQALACWYNHLTFLFNVKGQDRFKQRFRPTEEPRYTFGSNTSSVGLVLSLIRATGSSRPNMRNLSKNLWRSVKQKFGRSSR